MPRSHKVTGSSIHPNLHAHIKQRVHTRIPPGNRKRINGLQNSPITFTPYQSTITFKGISLLSANIEKPSPSFLPSELRDFLFNLLNNEKGYPVRNVKVTPEKIKEHFQIRSEAALALSLSGYTKSRLVEQIKALLVEITKSQTSSEVSNPEKLPEAFTFTIFTGYTTPQTTIQNKRAKEEIYLVAALYNIYLNLNDIQQARKLAVKYSLSEDELIAILQAFKPKMLEKLIPESLVKKVPG